MAVLVQAYYSNDFETHTVGAGVGTELYENWSWFEATAPAPPGVTLK